MTYAEQAANVGRQPVLVLEIDLDYCENTYGTLPCTAAGATGTECVNTFETCQDSANYSSDVPKTYRFCDELARTPASLDAIPCIISYETAPTVIDPAQSLGLRASVTVTLQDFPDDDRDTDPYIGGREYDASARGTFFTKLLARNPYYQGRTMRLRSGYLTDPIDFNEFIDQEYIIEKIEGPDVNGNIKIIGKDFLKLADDERSKCPVLTTGALTADITETATSLSVTAGTGAEYESSNKHIRIGSEIILFTTRSGDTFTGLQRGSGGTEASAHSQGDSVQQCTTYASPNVVDIIFELLTTYASIDSSYINTTDWNDLKNTWMTAFPLTTIISEPTGVRTLLNELCEQCALYLWWDDVAQKIRIDIVKPPTPGTTLTALDDEDILADTGSYAEKPELRFSQVHVYYYPKSFLSTDKDNYQRHLIVQDTDLESADAYGDTRIKEIFSRWYRDSDAAVLEMASRLLNQRKRTPGVYTFELDAAEFENVEVGDLVDITTNKMVNAWGLPLERRILVLERREAVQGSRILYRGRTNVFGYYGGGATGGTATGGGPTGGGGGGGCGIYGFVAPTGTVDYLSATATAKESYCWIAGTGDTMSNGDCPYLIF